MKFAALVVAVAIVSSACSSPPPPPAKVLTDDEFVAKVSATAQYPSTTAETAGPIFGDYNAAGALKVCRKFVLDGLKAPATAQFPDAPVAVTRDLGEGKFRITAAVDSQNSFGALIRDDYDCSVHWAHGTTWILDRLDLRGR